MISFILLSFLIYYIHCSACKAVVPEKMYSAIYDDDTMQHFLNSLMFLVGKIILYGATILVILYLSEANIDYLLAVIASGLCHLLLICDIKRFKEIDWDERESDFLVSLRYTERLSKVLWLSKVSVLMTAIYWIYLLGITK